MRFMVLFVAFYFTLCITSAGSAGNKVNLFIYVKAEDIVSYARNYISE